MDESIHAQHLIPPRTQVAVLVALLVLTGLTVGVSLLDISGRWHLAAGVSIAVIKATLVVLFFMHVWHAPAATRAVVVVAIFWLFAVLMSLVMCDYATREIVPVVSGHDAESH